MVAHGEVKARNSAKRSGSSMSILLDHIIHSAAEILDVYIFKLRKKICFEYKLLSTFVTVAFKII